MKNPKCDDRPNIVLIQLDDLGYDDLAIHGNPLAETPNLDALGRESVRFEDFTVNPVSAPSRATLLTGRHFLRTGVSHVHGGKDFLDLSETTLADVLRKQGYATGMWGKWHLGHTEGYFPWQRGFDEAWMAQLYKHRQPKGKLNGTTVQHDGWADSVMVDYALSFIEKHQSKPFFAYLASMTPHGPLDAPEPIIERFIKRGLSRNLATLYAMVTLLDTEIGRLLDGINKLGLTENTMILFMSDNGPAINDHEFTDEDRRLRKISGRRGWKGDIWENGVRSPLFIRWPGHLQPRLCDDPIDHVELFPTLLEYCGVDLKQTGLALDGISLRPLLETSETLPDRPIYNYSHRGWLTGGAAYSPAGQFREYDPVPKPKSEHLQFTGQSISIREGQYKLLLNPAAHLNGAVIPEYVLVDLKDDPTEKRDVSAGHPEIVARLRPQLEAWFSRMVEAPASFGSPLYKLGPEAESVISGKGASLLGGGLRNTAFAVQDWAAPGDFAEYKVQIDHTITASVTLDWERPPPNNWQYEIAPGNGCKIHGITDGKAHTIMGEITLHPGINTVRLALGDASSAAAVSPSLRAIHFTWK